MIFKRFCLIFVYLVGLSTFGQMKRDKETNLVIPSPGQLMWHNDEVGVFYHMNPTFPVENMTFANFDPVKIIDAAESVGAKHIVIVCKHVNGFCWWPTKAAKPGEDVPTRCISNTKFKDGKGDVVREIFDEARKRGIRPGVYLATRDDHFGAGEKGAYKHQKVYNDYYMTQATELATKYGQLAEWWVDGSSNPKLGKRLHDLLQKHQKNVVVFQSNYATIRWVGNEHGHAPYPIWNTIDQSVWDRIHLQSGRSVTNGNPDGVRWVPAEVDTTFTSGWFGGAPRSLEALKKVFYHSVGNGVGLLINFPVQRDGTISPAVLERAKEFHEYRENAIGHKLYQIDNQKGKVVTLNFKKPAEIDHVGIKEDLRFGERIRKFKLEAWNGKEWFPVIEDGISLGYQIIRKLKEPVVVSKVRLTVEESVGEPRIKSIYVTRFGLKKPDLSPPSTPKRLSAVARGREVQLKWTPSKDSQTGIREYAIFRNGKLYNSTTQTSYLDDRTVEGKVYSYKVRAKNGTGRWSKSSPLAKVKTKADKMPPKIKEVKTLPGRKHILVSFNETLSKISAERVSNYAVKGNKIVSAELAGTGREITLELAKRVDFGSTIKLLARNVADRTRAGNKLKSGSFPIFVDNYGLNTHWTFDELSSGEVKNEIGETEGKNLTLSGNPTLSLGQTGKAVEFDGNNYMSCDLAGVQTNFTISFWCKPKSLNGMQVMFAKERSGSRAYQFRMFLNGNKLGFNMTNDQGEGFELWPFEVSDVIKAGEWNHVVLVNKDKLYQIYVNGKVIVEKETSDILQQPYNMNKFILGANWHTEAKAYQHFSGVIDDFRIYSQPLPEAEIMLQSKHSK